MSDEVVEQITKDPPPPEKKRAAKEKDPKKVAAGKKLAEYNKRAKEALARETAREMKREAEIKQEETINAESESKAWIPELSFTTVLSLVGIGFTAVDMFMRYYKNRNVHDPQIPLHKYHPQIFLPNHYPTNSENRNALRKVV